MRRTPKARRGERGSIIVMTAGLMLGLVLAVGLCIDVARFYMVRAELQNAADAAALSAVRELNSSIGGLADAYTRATAAIGNTYSERRETSRILTPAPVRLRVRGARHEDDLTSVLDKVSAGGFYVGLMRRLEPGERVYAHIKFVVGSSEGKGLVSRSCAGACCAWKSCRAASTEWPSRFAGTGSFDGRRRISGYSGPLKLHPDVVRTTDTSG